MAQHFQIKQTDGSYKDYVAVGSAYNLFAASKSTFSLPGFDPEPAVDLLKLSAVETVLADIYQNKGKVETIPEWPEYERFTSNPVLAWHALYFLCHQQYGTEERVAFIRSIDDESTQPAMKALFGALADFFDYQQRPLTASALRTSIEAATILAEKARTELAKAVTPETVVNALLQQAGGGSSNSSAESGSGPAIPGSKKSKASKKSSGTPKESEVSS